MVKTNFLKITAAALVMFFGFANFSALASERDSGVYSYVFHLYYDRGSLKSDKSFEPPFELVAKQYRLEHAMGFFSGEILSIKDESLAKFAFSLESVPVAGSGKITVEAPYFSNAKKVVFSTEGKILLTIDLAPGGPLCNEDGVCNVNFGEDIKNCPQDCSNLNVAAEPEKDVPATGSKNRMWPFIIIVAAVLVIIAVIGWIALKKGKV